MIRYSNFLDFGDMFDCWGLRVNAAPNERHSDGYPEKRGVIILGPSEWVVRNNRMRASAGLILYELEFPDPREGRLEEWKG
jgi:hypothetical protein